ncbi:MAG: hypothetical protein HY332_06480 [Chloroflexi bacterium]|nr:hypothetical protein [Chloroflexota bacterium]
MKALHLKRLLWMISLGVPDALGAACALPAAALLVAAGAGVQPNIEGRRITPLPAPP